MMLLDGFTDRELRERGVGASVHFDPPVHLQPYYEGRMGKLELPIAEQVAGSIVTLPMYPQMSEEELTNLVGIVNACARDILV